MSKERVQVLEYCKSRNQREKTSVWVFNSSLWVVRVCYIVHWEQNQREFPHNTHVSQANLTCLRCLSAYLMGQIFCEWAEYLLCTVHIWCHICFFWYTVIEHDEDDLSAHEFFVPFSQSCFLLSSEISLSFVWVGQVYISLGSLAGESTSKENGLKKVASFVVLDCYVFLKYRVAWYVMGKTEQKQSCNL